MLIRIKNLRLRTLVGVQEWEKDMPQDVIINIEMECDVGRAAQTDDLMHTVDYKKLKKRILQLIETKRYNLIETLAHDVLRVAMEDSRVMRVLVEVDKPNALRYADSVSVVCTANRRP